MSMKDCVVLVYPKDQEPYVVRDPKGEFFSKKEAQRQATAHLKNGGDLLKAEVFAFVQVVNPAVCASKENPRY